MAKVVIISGNPSKTSRLNGLIQAAQQKLQQAGIHTDLIQVADLPAEHLISAKFDSPEILQANALVEQADAVIIASPVYKAAYTGVLKVYLDLLPQKGLEGKLILPLFIGGSIAHLLSIDYALKPVLSALGARHQLAGVYATDATVSRTEHGAYELADEIKQRLEASLNEFIQELKWHVGKKSQIS